MDESNDVLALKKISTEVGESQIKVFLSSQCIKAQAFLVAKLRKQIERSKEVSNFISSANVKLEGEIKHAELEIRSMLLAQDTIKSANVELKKELLLAKDKKDEIIERIDIGVKKYDALWMECKQRFETIPFVQKFLEATERSKKLKKDIESMGNEAQKIYKDIVTRKYICMNLDKERVIELANFMINELPNKTKLIQEKTEGINALTIQINDLLKAKVCATDETELTKQKLDTIDEQVKTTTDNGNSLPCSTLAPVKVDDDNLIPKLELADFDFDFNDINLDQVIKRNVEVYEQAPVNASPEITSLDLSAYDRKDERADEFIISAYVYKPIIKENTQCFSKRKLINILEDVKIDQHQAYNIVSKINPEKIQVVHEISAECSEDKDNTIKEGENIEVIDLTSTNSQNIIIPPTQFLDITVEETLSKKRVSFDLRTKMQINELNEDDNGQPTEETSEQSHNISSQLDVSAGSDESYMKIKDLILKKHNLDLSPPFVYAKNNIMQKNDDDGVLITSKFFGQDEKSAVERNTYNITDMEIQPEAKADEDLSNLPEEQNVVELENKDTNDIPMECDEMIVSSAKPNEDQLNEDQQLQKPISGLLFTHGTQGIPESLNVSMSTTGYEDSDFPHCIDSSLLLSPKADIPMTVDNTEVLSQDVPNFLSGLWKTGLSFFGGGPSTSSKPDSSAQNQGNSFSFNFGDDDKKNRGGLFSMFH